MASLFRSARLTYRAMNSDDLDELYEIYNDPEILIPLMYSKFSPCSEKFKETIKSWSETNPLFVIAVDTETGAFVGQASIRYKVPPVMRDGELGLLVKRSMWGKGYGTEFCAWIVQHSFKFLGLHRVSLGVFASNDGAIAMYKKVGFVQEGVKRQARFCDGRWDDMILMGILEDEFFTKGNDK